MRAVEFVVRCAALLSLSLNVSALLRSPLSSTQHASPFEWSEIKPSRDLVYHDCYPIEGEWKDGRLGEPKPAQQILSSGRIFQCARLLLPLDWHDPSNKNEVAIAIIKLPATVDVTDPSYGGTIIVNPGGPGGSGIRFLLDKGQELQEIVDSKKHFEMLSFDPRGVSLSTPNAHCFRDSLFEEMWELKLAASGNLDAAPNALNTHWAAAGGRGALCASQEVSGYGDDDKGDNIRQHVTTAYVAQEMLEMIDKIEQLRQYSHKHRSPPPRMKASQQVNIVKNTPQLNFLGFSYGTFLGNTFASLYPEHVGSMVLDGNIDANDWVSTGPVAHLRDTEKAWSTFASSCFSSRATCALYRVNDTSPRDIENRVNELTNRLKRTPAYTLSNGDTGLITRSDLKYAIFASLYSPLTSFPMLAAVVNDLLLHGMTRKRLARRADVNPPPCLPGSFSSNLPPGFDTSALTAVICSDGEDVSGALLTDFKQYLSILEAQSPMVGAIAAEGLLSCMAWPKSLRPKWRYTGPFATSKHNTTTSPILFINNRLDPVTPIENAHEMAKGHPGSVVLEQDSTGHIALRAPGSCMIEHVRKYFDEGTLPRPGTVCPVDCSPFEDACFKSFSNGGWFDPILGRR